MHPEDMFPPELMSDLFTFAIGLVLIVMIVAAGVLSKKARDERRRREENHTECLKTEIPEDGEQPVCIQDQYAQSMVRPYLPDQDEDCPECPECYCSIHGMNCPDIFKRLRGLVDDFTLDSSLHEGSRFELGQAAAYGNAATKLAELLDELEGKDKSP